MLDVEGKCIRFVYRLRERERDGGRERWEGALSLEDAVATRSLHVRLFHPKLSQQTSAAPSISRGNA